MGKSVTLAAVVAAALCLGGTVFAAERPNYGPDPAWVRPVPIPAETPAQAGAAAQLLLQNNQRRFGDDADERFTQTAVRFLTPQGLSDVGTPTVAWDPATETATIHRLNIIRNGQVIDLLHGGKAVQILRRETNLDLAMLDGELTAVLQPEGVQVGDILDFAYSISRRDPLWRGKSSGEIALGGERVARAYLRAVWPASKPLNWKAAEGLGAPVLSRLGQDQDLVVDMRDATSPEPPNGAPKRFAYLGELDFSQFQTWSELSAVMAPLFAKASILHADSPVRAEIAAIAKASPDARVRAALALRLVQEKVRYLALSMGDGGYVPADADETWTRRFGDCKGKTALLLAVLHGLGVQAEAVLVDTETGDTLINHLPQMLFDHVLVRATIEGKAYWMDGTKLGETRLESLPVPDYRWVLPVREIGAVLEPLIAPPFTQPHWESVLRIDASGGPSSPAKAHEEQIYRGDDALDLAATFLSEGRAAADKRLRDYWRDALPWVRIDRTDFHFDDQNGVLTVSMDGQGAPDWAKDGQDRLLWLNNTGLGDDVSFERPAGPHADAPFAVDYPRFKTWKVIVTLPKTGGYNLVNPDAVDQTAAGVRYRRQARMEAGQAIVETSEQAVQPEFPAKDASAAAKALRELADYDVGLRWSDPDSRSVDAALSGCEESETMPDLGIVACSQVIKQNPSLPNLADVFRYRALGYYQKGQMGQAMQDLNAAVQRAPNDPASFSARGYLKAQLKDAKGALADYDHALDLNPNFSTALEERADLFAEYGQWDKAIADYDRAVTLEPQDSDLYLRRGLARSDKGDRDGAIADMNKAIAIKPDDSAYLVDRGQVHHDANHFDLAVADYNQALKLRPEFVPGLLGRAEAYGSLRNWAAALDDLAAALRIEPQSADALTQRCMIRAATNQDLPGALEDCSQALSLQPPNYRTMLLNTRVVVYIRLEKWNEALADLDTSDKAAPDAGETLFLRGIVHRRQGNEAAAAADLARARKLDASVEPMYAGLGIRP